MYWIWSGLEIAPERWMASAASWARAGEEVDVQGGAVGPVSQVPGPWSAPVDAMRAPVRTRLETPA